MRPKKIKLGNQKERLSDLEKLWYYDPYFVDYALHNDTGKPWKIHRKRINPLVFPPIIQLVRDIKKYYLQVSLTLLLLFFSFFINYWSQIIDWIVSYNIQLSEMLDERERAEAEKREKLLSLSAEGFHMKMDEDADDNMGDELYDKADHLTMDELEINSSTTAPLTSNEILSAEDIKNILSITWIYNNGLSDEEYRIVKSALLTVGRIPYILGGAQPTRPSNTEKDENGFPVVPDDAIVSFANQISGMDCSHWVDWIYFIAMNNNLGYCNTDSMIYTQGNGALKLIAVDEEGTDYDQGLSNIRAGDIMVYGFDASHKFGHAGIFLGYAGRPGTDALDMMYVHESSSAGNVSFHVGDAFGNNGSSPVFYFRYKSFDGEGIDYDYDYLRQLQSGVRGSGGAEEPVDTGEAEAPAEEYTGEEAGDASVEGEAAPEGTEGTGEEAAPEGEGGEAPSEGEGEAAEGGETPAAESGEEGASDTSGTEGTAGEETVSGDSADTTTGESAEGSTESSSDSSESSSDSESYSQYESNQEAESYKPSDPESSDLYFGKDLVVAP